MPRSLETKACDACAIAKRRCEKQTPHCRRCRVRGIECTYPPTKPGPFTLFEGENTFSVEQDVSTLAPLLFSSPPQLIIDSGLPPQPDLSLVNITSGAQPTTCWFTSSEAWKVDPFPGVTGDALCINDIKYHIKNIHEWLKQWVAKGSNPFIHARLYQTRFPQCIQDAHMIISCYFSKTDLNELTVFRIIEERARRLVEDGLAGCSLLGTPLDTHEHLARVQALTIYQAICLYDGDIRLRHLSEGYIPVLNSWIREMIDHATQATCLGHMVMSSPYEDTAIDPSSSENLLWYSWILAESIRRTSMLAASVQSIYLIHRDGTASCHGSMTFTTRQGAWDVDSAYTWEKMCSEVNVGFVQLAEAPILLTKAVPDDVDEFAKAMLSIICGASRVNRWINR